jgi:uncharacterized membrane protein
MSWFTDRRIQIILILVQLIVCVPFINSFSIDLDEPFSVFWAQQDLMPTLEFFSTGNNPPLHNILLHFWMKLFGNSPEAVRSLSLLFSLLTIPVLYQFAKKVLDKPFAVVVCSFFIFSTFNHYHALEARNYSLMVLLAALIFKDLYSLVLEDSKMFWRLAIWNGLMLYNHYLGFYIIGCEILIFFLFAKHLNLKKIIYFGSSLLITALLYLPSLITFFKRLSDFANSGTWVAEPHPTELYGNIVRFLNGRETVILLVIVAVALTACMAMNVKGRLIRLITDKRYLFVFATFLVLYVGMYIFSIQIQPIFLDRYLLYTTPFLFLSLGIVYKILAADLEYTVFALVPVLPMALSCQYLPNNNRDADVMAAWVQDRQLQNRMVYLAPGYYDVTFLYYYDREFFGTYQENRDNPTDDFQALYGKDQLIVDTLAQQIFFVDAVSEAMYPGNGIKDSLESHFNLVAQKEFKGGHVIYEFSND